MDKTPKLLSLLEEAGRLAAGDRRLESASAHIRRAARSVSEAAAKREKRKNSGTAAGQWWDGLVAGTAAGQHAPAAAAGGHAAFAGEATLRSLERLDLMISAEQKKLKELERMETEPDVLEG